MMIFGSCSIYCTPALAHNTNPNPNLKDLATDTWNSQIYKLLSSASEVTTLRRYTKLFIIIIIIK